MSAPAPDRPSQSLLLPPRLLGRLERLQLSTRRRLAGVFSGEHRSRRYGTSLDFADYREYHPGDDFRRIDYHMLARLDVLLIKLFEAEDDLEVRLLVDTSLSMSGAKMQRARELAAALGFVALVRRDAVHIHTFPEETRGPRFLGRGAASPMFRHLQNIEPSGQTRFIDAAAHLLSRTSRPGVTIVISDLLTGEWEEGLRRLANNRSDLVVMHLLDRSDIEPDLEGDLDLVDSETGGRVPVSLTPQIISSYAELANRWAERVADACREGGAVYVRTFTEDDLEETLLGEWRRSGVVR